MVNSDDFIKRLEFLMDYYSLSASGLADKIGVQRSSMSHLMSGRNKPSLDFIMKINDNFKDVDLYWLLNGKGNFLKLENKTTIQKNENEKIQKVAPPTLVSEIQENLFSDSKAEENENPIFENNFSENPNTAFSSSDKKTSNIERIVIFYDNGTFSEHQPR